MPFTHTNELVSDYTAAYGTLKEALEGLSEEDMSRPPAPGKWCIKEILCHLMDGEIIWVGRLKRIIAEDNPFLPSYDQDKFAEKLRYRTLDAKAALLTFGMLRSTTAEVLAHLNDNDWERKGTHDARGEVTLKDMLAVMVDHDKNHLQQIRDIRMKTLGLVR